MKATKFPALTQLTEPELVEKAAGLRKGLYGLRVQQGQRTLTRTADVRVTRRELARVLTALARLRAKGAS